MEVEDRPEWLPDGWTVGVRATRSGSKHTYYTSLESGRLFSSKADVLNYLNNEKTMSHATKTAPQYIESKKQFKQEESPPAWLPKGWIMEIKSHKSGPKEGKKYKCYFDPSTGTRCYSKREVFEFLAKEVWFNTSAKEKALDASEFNDVPCKIQHSPGRVHRGCCMEVKSRKTTVKNGGVRKEEVQFKTPEGLPCGWIKEIRFRNKETSGEPKKDPYYIDPEHGYVFRSFKDALRYVETGYISERVKREKRMINDSLPLESESPHPALFKKQNVGEKVNQCLFLGLKASSDECVQMDMLLERPEIIHSSDASPKVEEKLDVLGNNRTGETSTEKVRRHGSKSKAHKAISVPLRASKRLAGFEADFVDLKELAPIHNALSTEKVDVKGNSRISENSAEKVIRHGCKSMAQKTTPVPLRASKRLAGSEVEFVGELPLRKCSAVKKNSIQLNATSDKEAEIIQQPVNNVELDSKSEMELDLSGKTHKEDVPEKTGYDEINDLHELPWKSWPDPCIEFAFKTLTNDIPLEVVDRMLLDPSDKVHLNPESENVDEVEHKESTEMKQLDAFDYAPLWEKLVVEGNNSTNENSTENVRRHGSKSQTPKKISEPLCASKRLAGSDAAFVGELTPSKCSAGIENNNSNFSHLSVQLNVTSAKEVEIIQRPDNKNEFDSKSNMELDLSGKTEKEEVPEKTPEDTTNDFQDQLWNSWPDPCIEFAFKTLTSDIPFLNDTLSIEEYLKQQQLSINGLWSNGFATLPSSYGPDARSEASVNGERPNESNLTTEKPKL